MVEASSVLCVSLFIVTKIFFQVLQLAKLNIIHIQKGFSVEMDSEISPMREYMAYVQHLLYAHLSIFT